FIFCRVPDFQRDSPGGDCGYISLNANDTRGNGDRPYAMRTTRAVFRYFSSHCRTLIEPEAGDFFTHAAEIREKSRSVVAPVTICTGRRKRPRRARRRRRRATRTAELSLQ